MVTVKERHAEIGEAKQVVPNQAPPQKQQKIARGIIRRMLVEFHREWTDLRSTEGGGTGVLTANALLDRHSHHIYDAVCDVEAVVGDDLAVEIRCLSVEMIKATNILIMIGCEEECYRRGDALAKEALRQAERCLALQRVADTAR